MLELETLEWNQEEYEKQQEALFKMFSGPMVMDSWEKWALQIIRKHNPDFIYNSYRDYEILQKEIKKLIPNSFEDHLNQASETVKSWPDWKQNVLGKRE